MIITFVNKNSKKVSVLHLPSKTNGKFWIKEKSKSDIIDIIGIEAVDNDWVAFSNQNYSLAKDINNLLPHIIIKPLHVYKVVNNFNKNEYYFYTEPSTKNRITFEKYYVDKSVKKISIGSSDNKDIVYKMFGAVSESHAILERKNDIWTLTDENSKNFTFYNDKILINDSILLKFGDIVTILGLKIVIGNDFISINNPDNTLIINNNYISLYKFNNNNNITNIISNNITLGIQYFYRSPRVKYEIIPPKIKVDPPPQKQTRNDVPIAMTLGSSLTMGVASLANGILTIYTSRLNGNDWLSCMPTLIMSGSMVLGTIAWPVILQFNIRKNAKVNENKRYAIYMNYIGDLRAKLSKEIDRQTEFLNQNYPSPAKCIERIINKDSKLWERSFFDNDFLSISLGLGDAPLNINMSFPDEKMTLADDSLSDEMFRLVNENWNITNAPIPFSLYQNRLVGVIGGHKSIFSFFHSIILQVCTLHSYNEVKAVLFADEKNIGEWGYARFLPHLFSDDRQSRYVASSVSEVQNIDIMLKKIISERIEKRNDFNLNNKKIPHYVIMFLQDYRKVNLKSFRGLIENSEEIGVTMIFFSEQYEALPVECKAIINIDKNNVGNLYSNFISSKDDVTFKIDTFDNQNINYSIALANTYLELNFNSKVLPKSITFLEMMNVSKVEHLNVAQKWTENTGTSTLAVPIGINNDGNKFILDLHEDAHGPHGLIAGMTGSGKSEFSITYILSLAIHYSPDTVSFLLIDYKGAGLTGAFENKDPEHAFRLPHLAGTITNLDGSAIQRAVVSIDTELKRRQEIFRETTQKYDTGTMNIYQYQKLYREGKVSVPLPHLFIISDEFAELKKQEPEFMDKLISTARIGRSLGVHLILATQKPAGVVNDQIWSNSKFRVCLKVQERADSIEVIKRPDAASLSVVGRFYLQVGYNELFSLGQSAWSGASYIPEQDFVKKDTREVQLIDYSGNVIDSKKVTSLYEKNELNNNSGKQETQLTAIVNYIIHIAKSMNFKPYNLWEEPLPKDIMISELKDNSLVISNMNDIKFAIGKWDNLYQRKQPVLTSSLTNDGNVVVYGSAQSGKQMFVQVAVDSMLMLYNSDRLNIYILDFDSEVLKEYIGFPQVGDVISDDESEKINNLFKMLQQKIKQRKKLLSSSGGSFSRYNNSSGNILPSIVVIIHNYVKFAENYSNLVSKVADLMQETKCGIYFIITTSETNCFTSKVRQQLSQVYALQLNQESEYSALLGRTQGLKPQKLKGRGLFKKKIDGLDKDVFEFQTAQFCHEIQRENILVKFKKTCIKKCEGMPHADKVLVLPDKINIDTSDDVMFDIKNMFIGYSYSSMKPEYININDEYIHCIFSSDQNSLISFSQGLAEFISYCFSHSSESANDIVYVIDPQGMYYEDNNRKYKYVNDNISNTLNELLSEAQQRNEALTAYEEGRDTNEENVKFPLIVCIIVSYSGLQMKLNEEEWGIFSEILRYSRQLGFRFEVFSDSSSAGSFMDSEWYARYAKNNATLWVGEGLRSQVRISWKGRLQEPFKHMSDSYGYAIRNGKTTLVKLIATYLKEEDTF